MAKREIKFQTIRSEGGLLPPDFLSRLVDSTGQVPGVDPAAYGLPAGDRLTEAIAQSWTRLGRHWAEFRKAREELPEGDAATGLTNDKWSLPLLRELGFGFLPTTAGPVIDDKTYAISRFAGPTPVHLMGCGVSLDRRTEGVRGAARSNPHGLVQEFLNRSPDHLWAVVSNGLHFRILRDNQALSRQAYLEFDLEALCDGEVFSDFVVLWLLAHATRFLPRENGRGDSCWLEVWTKEAEKQGTRALIDLRVGVEKALQILGQGFVGHPKNGLLREKLRTGQLKLDDFHGQLLRVVYRLIFLFVAEDRELDGASLIHPRDDSEHAHIARQRYSTHYSARRLRDLAQQISGSRHSDLWRQFQLLVGALSGDDHFAAARESLALSILGSFLWSPAATAALNAFGSNDNHGDGTDLANAEFLEAIRNLAFTRQGTVLRPVDYKNLGSEELGGVYESLLALTPQISGDGSKFTFAEFAGNERKTSGAYYTPDSLVQCLLDSALDPVVDETIKGKSAIEAERAILALKVCDPAVGSGHFLIGAAHRLARHLARIRALAQGESEPSPLLYQHALRDVIGHCLYGVDVNPMAAELCRVSLWLEALEPGKPLSFLDHHIRVGNSLLGATPELIAADLPDEAFTPIEGDDRQACTVLKRRNRSERGGLGPLYAEQDAEIQARLQQAAAALEELPDDRSEDIRAKELAFRCHEHTDEYRQKKQLADAWCAAFVMRKQFSEPGRESSASGLTQGHLNGLADGRPLTLEVDAEVGHLSGQYQLFHWHLAFPEVFARGGFDCVLGNPPWERVNIQEKEWFAERSPAIANASNTAARKRLIEALKAENPSLYEHFLDDSRKAEGESHLMRNSGRYPLCGRGDINTYAVFAEGMRNLLNPAGRVGCVLPTGIATDDTTKFFVQDVVEKKSLVSLFDFENKGIFPGVHSSYKFCLFTTGRGLRPTEESAEFVFFAHAVEDIRDPERRFSLSAEDIALLNPNSHTCPIFRSRRDAELTILLHTGRPTFLSFPLHMGGGEETRMRRMFHMSDNAGSFHTSEELRGKGMLLDGNIWQGDSDAIFLPLIEPKMIWQFDHHYASFSLAAGLSEQEVTPISCSDHAIPALCALPRYWLSKEEFIRKNALLPAGRGFLCFRNVSNATNERTMVSVILPLVPLNEHLPVIYLPAALGVLPYVRLTANLNSFVLDYLLRNKMGGTAVTYGLVEQLPSISPSELESTPSWCGTDTVGCWIDRRALELTYTAWDLEPFARDCGWTNPPFRWDEKRRFLLRCELDAAFFHLYLPTVTNGDWHRTEQETAEDLARLKVSFPTPRDAVAYIMDTFPIVKRKEEEKWGEYRTKRVMLEIYDAMQESIRTGQPYQTRLNPPPADPHCCHPTRETFTTAEPARVLPFRRVRPSREERYKTCVPLLSLKAAAGAFSGDQAVEFEDWVEVHASHRLQKGMFLAQVVGRSMEPLIPEGAYCLFRYPVLGTREGKVVLVQYRDIDDPETGGNYTIKTYESEKIRDDEGGWRHGVIRLLPSNPSYQPIVLRAVDEGAVRVIAEFVEVLR